MFKRRLNLLNEMKWCPVSKRGNYIITGKYAHLVRKTYPGAMWRNSKRTHKVKWHCQDPLYFNYEYEHIQGTLKRIIQEMKILEPHNEVPLRKIAYFIYHMGEQRVYDYNFMQTLQKHVPFNSMRQITAREAMGAIVGYFKLGRGDLDVLQIFYQQLKLHVSALHNEDIIRYIECFSEQTRFPRSHFDNYMSNLIKPRLMTIWNQQIKYRPDIHAPLMRACLKMKYYDKDVWDAIWPCVFITRRYRMEDQTFILETAAKLNDDPEFYNFQKLGDVIEKLENRIRNNPDHREWRYNLEERRYKTFEEMLAQRDRYLDTEDGWYQDLPGMKEMREQIKFKEELEIKRRKAAQEKQQQAQARLERRMEIYEEFKKKVSKIKDDDEIDVIIEQMGLSEAELSQFEDWLEVEHMSDKKSEFVKTIQSGPGEK